MVRIGPVIVQTFPHTTGAFRNISLGPALLMHCEVFVSAIGEELRTARTEIGESSDVLLRCQVGCLVKMDGWHCITLFPLCFVVQDGSDKCFHPWSVPLAVSFRFRLLCQCIQGVPKKGLERSVALFSLGT